MSLQQNQFHSWSRNRYTALHTICNKTSVRVTRLLHSQNMLLTYLQQDCVIIDSICSQQPLRCFPDTKIFHFCPIFFFCIFMQLIQSLGKYKPIFHHQYIYFPPIGQLAGNWNSKYLFYTIKIFEVSNSIDNKWLKPRNLNSNRLTLTPISLPEIWLPTSH